MWLPCSLLAPLVSPLRRAFSQPMMSEPPPRGIAAQSADAASR
jgi:hypothetical protein